MSDEDIGCRQRGDAELEQSRQTICPEAVRAHLDLSSAYRQHLAEAEPAPSPAHV